MLNFGVPHIGCSQQRPPPCDASSITELNSNHELRTPLHAITGSVELLLDGSVGPLSKEAHDIVELIAVAARQLDERLAMLEELRTIDDEPLPQRHIASLAEIVQGRPLVARNERSLLGGEQLCAFVHLANVARVWQLLEIPIDSRIKVIDDGRSLTLLPIDPLPDCRSGEGAIARGLAERLVQRSGGHFDRSGPDRIAIVIQKADASDLRHSSDRNPISS